MARRALSETLGLDEVQKEAEPTKVVPIAHEAKSEKPVKSSLYLPPKALRKLKELALSKDCKVHDLYIQGIDHVLKSEGFPTVKEFSGK
ncbi:hypothetical protein J7382_19550 [Shimia sp. R11_0]|uniref:hypothetical protein n=1 Tax=Shimia sp. R11_0 TaxID=2821096 RepID=UPI001ADBDBC7|nr:hypothetical protein [Shimia sp. R11_0]MBO9479744.1 hypothetical protein [Shimia sp. R11_0]